MDYDILMERINQTDKNAFLVIVEGEKCVDVTSCSIDGIDKIRNVLQEIFNEELEHIHIISDEDYFYCKYCNKNKWWSDGFTNYARTLNNGFVCTDCLLRAGQNNID